MQSLSKSLTDPAYDILRSERQPLHCIFAPEAVAVVGASDEIGSVGRTLLWNLLSHPFGGTVYPVNPKHRSVIGVQTYPSITDIGEPVDLAIIATPAPTVPSIVRECVAAGVRGAIIISAGFKEIGAIGGQLEREIQIEASKGNMRIVGPNCLGVMNPHSGLNATFASGMARPGNVGFVSQSGALCTSILDWSFRENVGFSAFVSIGSMLDIGWGDLIYYLGDDPHTKSIVMYMESIGDARSFLSAAREVALTKPIIVIKAGRTQAAAQAAASHTGALTGSDAVLDAAFRRSGVLRVNRISELFNMAEVLAKQPRPKGPRLTIVTNAGGPGVLATDMLITTGGELASLSDSTMTELDQFLPPYWSHGNPIDILGDADPTRYTKTLDMVAKDSNSDGVLVILTPQAMTDPTQTAESVKTWLATQPQTMWGKPILASWMGGAEVMAGEAILNRASVPTYPYPDSAAQVFTYMWRYSYNLRGIYETPVSAEATNGLPDRIQAQRIIETARQAGRTLLTETESKQLLVAYGIPVVDTRVAKSEAEAVELANHIGYPVVLKLFSETITHKTDVGGIRLNLPDADTVRKAYGAIAQSVTEKVGPGHFEGVTVQPMLKLEGFELIIGSSTDLQFGPVILFGIGGQLVEVFRDQAVALPPLNTTLARRLMEQTQIYRALKGVRGAKPVDLDALDKLLVRFSQLVVEHRRIKEIDINPLLVRSGSDNKEDNTPSMVALDARIILHNSELPDDQLPKLAIRPYPVQYISPWTMPNGMIVTIRPIRPEDEPLAVKFHQSLSEQSIYFRYFHLVKLSHRIAHDRLIRLCCMDYDREMALVADHQDEAGNHELLAIARLSKLHGVAEAEFAMLVSDAYQRQGLGTELLKRLVQIGKDEGLSRITADILYENAAMQRVAEKVGFRLHRSADLVRAELDL